MENNMHTVENYERIARNCEKLYKFVHDMKLRQCYIKI